MREEPEWTEEERRALDALDRRVDPGRALEERTVAALRERGLLRSSGGAAPAPARRLGRAVWRHPAWCAAGMAAALALFLAGVTVGHARAAGEARDLVVALRAADSADRASWVQRTGSLYVEALAELAEAQARGDDEAVEAGVEVAAGALRAAALELARLHPEDARYARVLAALERPGGRGEGEGVRQVLWF